MSQPTPRQDCIFTFATDQEGKDIKWRFMITLSKKKGHNFGTEQQPDLLETRLLKAVGSLDGIDYINPNIGRYTAEVAIARTFDADEVIAELEARIKNEVLREVIVPKFIHP